jgi:hypothetical protein
MSGFSREWLKPGSRLKPLLQSLLHRYLEELLQHWEIQCRAHRRIR